MALTRVLFLCFTAILLDVLFAQTTPKSAEIGCFPVYLHAKGRSGVMTRTSCDRCTPTVDFQLLEECYRPPPCNEPRENFLKRYGPGNYWTYTYSPPKEICMYCMVDRDIMTFAEVSLGHPLQTFKTKIQAITEIFCDIQQNESDCRERNPPSWLTDIRRKKTKEKKLRSYYKY